MNYKLKWGFGGLPPITMLICIDCVVYNQYIIHDISPNIAECYRYYMWREILQVGEKSAKLKLSKHNIIWSMFNYNLPEDT